MREMSGNAGPSEYPIDLQLHPPSKCGHPLEGGRLHSHMFGTCMSVRLVSWEQVGRWGSDERDAPPWEDLSIFALSFPAPTLSLTFVCVCGQCSLVAGQRSDASDQDKIRSAMTSKSPSVRAVVPASSTPTLVTHTHTPYRTRTWAPLEETHHHRCRRHHHHHRHGNYHHNATITLTLRVDLCTLQPSAEANEAGAAVDGGADDYKEDEDSTVDLRPVRRVSGTTAMAGGGRK
jgi:hypothetical protein